MFVKITVFSTILNPFSVVYSSAAMASPPITCYCASPFSVDQLRNYRVFPSKNWSSSSSSSSPSPSQSPSTAPFDPAVLEPLGDFRVFSTELLFMLFDFMDFATLGKLSTSSSLFGAKIGAYLASTSGSRRCEFIDRLHDGQVRAP